MTTATFKDLEAGYPPLAGEEEPKKDVANQKADKGTIIAMVFGLFTMLMIVLILVCSAGDHSSHVAGPFRRGMDGEESDGEEKDGEESDGEESDKQPSEEEWTEMEKARRAEEKAERERREGQVGQAWKNLRSSKDELEPKEKGLYEIIYPDGLIFDYYNGQRFSGRDKLEAGTVVLVKEIIFEDNKTRRVNVLFQWATGVSGRREQALEITEREGWVSCKVDEECAFKLLDDAELSGSEEQPANLGSRIGNQNQATRHGNWYLNLARSVKEQAFHSQLFVQDVVNVLVGDIKKVCNSYGSRAILALRLAERVERAIKDEETNRTAARNILLVPDERGASTLLENLIVAVQHLKAVRTEKNRNPVIPKLDEIDRKLTALQHSCYRMIV